MYVASSPCYASGWPIPAGLPIAAEIIVALEAWFAHHAIWSQIKPEERPAAGALLASLRRIAQAHEEPGAGERSYAGMLAETLRGYIERADENLIGDGLEQLLADRAAPAWSRLHAYFAMTLLRDRGARAEVAALADPGGAELLRREAHPLLASVSRSSFMNCKKGAHCPGPPSRQSKRCITICRCMNAIPKVNGC